MTWRIRRAGGWLPDQVRLGLLETVLGVGVIEELCDLAVAAGLAKAAERKRLMPLCAMDGFEVALPATPENLKVFSCAGVPKDARPGTEKKTAKAADGSKRE